MKKLFILWVVLSLFLIGCSKTDEVTGNVVAESSVCKDSDNGITAEVKGIVSLGEETYADACVSGILIEYYCDGSQKANQNIRCPTECKDGKCI